MECVSALKSGNWLITELTCVADVAQLCLVGQELLLAGTVLVDARRALLFILVAIATVATLKLLLAEIVLDLDSLSFTGRIDHLHVYGDFGFLDVVCHVLEIDRDLKI